MTTPSLGTTILQSGRCPSYLLHENPMRQDEDGEFENRLTDVVDKEGLSLRSEISAGEAFIGLLKVRLSHVFLNLSKVG